MGDLKIEQHLRLLVAVAKRLPTMEDNFPNLVHHWLTSIIVDKTIELKLYTKSYDIKKVYSMQRGILLIF